MTATNRLAAFVADVDPKDIPDAAREVLRLSMLDWLAVGVAGAQEPVARICRDMVLAEAGTGQAALFGSAIRVPARAAALSNGTTSHALDYDDTHFAHIGHPSVAVMPAALAVAEKIGAGGAALQDAALIGAEVSVRVGMWLGRSHYQTGFHQTATAGAFGAAAACARLMGMDRSATRATLGLVATRASGLKSQFGTMGKPYNAGIAAANGVEAATLVAAGFVPNPDGLEVAQGFGPTHAGEARAAALDDLGNRWVFEGVSHKFHACCHGLHATLEALGTLLPVDADAVQRVSIVTHPRWMSVCNIPAPATGLEAKFSYPMVTAMALLGHDTAALGSYRDDLCRNPDMVALRERVDVQADDRTAETAAQVSIRLKDGSARQSSFDLDAPLPLERRRERVWNKAVALLGRERAARFRDLIATAVPASTVGAAISE